MRRTWIITFVLSCLFIALCRKVRAWENIATHPAITEKAAQPGSGIDNYLKTYLCLPDGIDTNLLTIWDMPAVPRFRNIEPNKPVKNALEWIKAGSLIEDEDGHLFIPPFRPRHHFHDPIRNAGLDNHADHPFWMGLPTLFPVSWIPVGESAVEWATEGRSLRWDPKVNEDTWKNARNAFYYSLIHEDKGWREGMLAETFLIMGEVIHLLEDMGVPAHTRNDFLYGHYRNCFNHGNELEKYVENQVVLNGRQSLWSGHSAVVFDKLEKYFDANVYFGDYLGDGVWPPNTWGLSECSNYQFLSLSTMFGCSGAKYQFPHPSKVHLGPDILVTVPDGNKVYFNGSNYKVPHIARMSYTYFVATGEHYYDAEIDNTNTVDDVQVFEDYANITVPRTIDYTAGLLNYFFRGRIQLRSRIESRLGDLLSVRLYIKNKSTLEANPLDIEFGFKGGQFEVYWDDANDVRHQIQTFTTSKTWNAESTLQYDEEMSIEFSDTVTNDLETAQKFIVVYKGNILKQPEYSIDEDDGEAVAVAMIDTTHIHNIPTTTLLLARFNGVYEDWFDPAEQFNNHGFLLTWYENRSGWEANPVFDGRQISIAPTFQNNRDRIFVDVEDDWNGNRIFHSSDWDPLEFFPHVVENDCDTSWCAGYDGDCTVSIWNIPNWEIGSDYREGDQVGWNSPEGDCFEVYTCTVNHTSELSNQPDVGDGFWLLGYPDVRTDLDIVGVSELDEENPGGTVQLNGPVVNINTLILSDWPDVWTNELNRGLATLEVITGKDKIRIWDNPDKTGQPVIDQGNPKKTWQLISEIVPVNLFVEGVALGDAAMDVRLKFTLNYAGVEKYDKVNFTVQE